MKAVLLLDSITKSRYTFNGVNLSASDFKIVNSFQELARTEYVLGQRVFVFEGIMEQEESIAFINVLVATTSMQFIYVGDKFADAIAMCDFISVYPTPVKDITSSLLESVLAGDTSYRVTKAESLQEYDDLSSAVNRNLQHIVYTVMAEDRKLHESVDALSLRNIQLETRLEQVVKEYGRMLKSVASINKTLEQYELSLTSDAHVNISLYDFPDRPAVLYFKVLSPIHFCNDLMITMWNVIRLQMRKSAKVIALYDAANSRGMQLLPQNFHKLGNSFTYSDVVQNDFLAKAGNPIKVMETLLSNRIALQCLVVFDFKGDNNAILLGDYMHVDICTSEGDAKIFNCASVITEDGEHAWSPSQKINFKNESERLLYLSSQPVIGWLLTEFRDHIDVIRG